MKLLLGLANRSLGQALVKGGLVARVQSALGFAQDNIDGVYGPNTSRKVKAWQAEAGRAETGVVTLEDWTALTGEDPPEIFERCLQVTMAFEGHDFELCKGNFDGALLTWGIIGFTWKHGEIQELISRIDALDPAIVPGAFGPLVTELRKAIAMDVKGREIVEWVNEISEEPFGENLKPEWTDAFEALGKDPAVRALQRARAKEKYWESRALPDANRLSMTSDLGHALCFDISVQCGGVSDKEAGAFQEAVQTRGANTPEARRIVLADVVAENTTNRRFIEDVRKRKQTMATGVGRVHMADYELSLWGLSDPAPDPTAILDSLPASAAAEPEVRFAEFFRTLDLEHFAADELLMLGGAHFKQGHRGFGKNTLPPEHLWPNIATAARVLDRLRAEIGKPIRLLSVYRSPLYNSALKGAANSQHMHFTAADFTVLNGGPPREWARILAGYRSRGIFSGGIGLYPDQGFVHVDGRGEDKNFGTLPLS